MLSSPSGQLASSERPIREDGDAAVLPQHALNDLKGSAAARLHLQRLHALTLYFSATCGPFYEICSAALLNLQ